MKGNLLNSLGNAQYRFTFRVSRSSRIVPFLDLDVVQSSMIQHTGQPTSKRVPLGSQVTKSRMSVYRCRAEFIYSLFTSIVFLNQTDYIKIITPVFLLVHILLIDSQMSPSSFEHVRLILLIFIKLSFYVTPASRHLLLNCDCLC